MRSFREVTTLVGGRTCGILASARRRTREMSDDPSMCFETQYETWRPLWHIWCYILFLLFCGSHSEWMVWHYIALWHVDGSSLSRHQTHNIVIFSRICS